MLMPHELKNDRAALDREDSYSVSGSRGCAVALQRSRPGRPIVDRPADAPGGAAGEGVLEATWRFEKRRTAEPQTGVRLSRNRRGQRRLDRRLGLARIRNARMPSDVSPPYRFLSSAAVSLARLS
jgi:hypothetical protein